MSARARRNYEHLRHYEREEARAVRHAEKRYRQEIEDVKNNKLAAQAAAEEKRAVEIEERRAEGQWLERRRTVEESLRMRRAQWDEWRKRKSEGNGKGQGGEKGWECETLLGDGEDMIGNKSGCERKGVLVEKWLNEQSENYEEDWDEDTLLGSDKGTHEYY